MQDQDISTNNSSLTETIDECRIFARLQDTGVLCTFEWAEAKLGLRVSYQPGQPFLLDHTARIVNNVFYDLLSLRQNFNTFTTAR